MTTTTAVPAEPQYMVALGRANKVRLARAELKRQIREGEVAVATVVLNCPREAASMKVADLLMAQKRWGRTRTRKFLAGIPLIETKTVGSLTDRQRRALAKELGYDPPPQEGTSPTARTTFADQMRDTSGS